jgi:lysophospholipase L1-like esterase
VKKTALVSAGVILSLLLVEIFLRITGFGQIQPTLQFDLKTRAAVQAGFVVADSDLLWRQADTAPTEFDRMIKAVHVGQPAPTKGRKYRIICLGDSCTRIVIQGWPYSFLLEGRIGPDRVEVFNASVPGYTSYQGLAWVKMQLLQYEPDLIVVYFGWNDHWRSTGMTDREYAATLSPWRPRLLQLFRRRVEPPPVRVSQAEFRENLQQIATLVRQHGGQLLLLTGPSHITAAGRERLLADGYIRSEDEPERMHRRYLDIVRSLDEEPATRVYDAARLFDQLNDPEQLLHLDGIHPTDLGHAVLAAQLAEYIDQHYRGSPLPAIDPVGLSLVVMAQSRAATNQWEEALALYRRAVESTPQERGPRLGLAWLLATCPHEEWRDGRQAMALLEPWQDAADPSPQFLDVRAAVLAETGRFEAAVEVARETLRLCEVQGHAPSSYVEGVRERLALYEAGQPYRLPELPQP